MKSLNNEMFFFSFFDFITDCFLANDYFNKTVDVDNSMANFVESQTFYGPFTVLFILLPSFNVMGSLVGPSNARVVGSIWGILLIVGAVCLMFLTSVTSLRFSVTMGLFGIYLVIRGLHQNFVSCCQSFKIFLDFCKDWKVLPFTITITILSVPCHLFIHLQSVLRPGNKFIDAQSFICFSAEAFFEATPQLIFQLYIILKEMKITYSQGTAIISSLFCLDLTNIQTFLTNRKLAIGPINFFKYLLIFFFHSAFKTGTLACFFLFFGYLTPLVILSLYISVHFPLYCIYKFCSCCLRVEKEKRKIGQFFLDNTFQAWLTIPNLEKTSTQICLRKLSTILNVMISVIGLGAVLIISYTDPEVVPTISIHEFELNSKWSDLSIVKNKACLLVLLPLACGLFSLLLDLFFYRRCCNGKEYQSVFWESTIVPFCIDVLENFPKKETA